MKFRALHVRIAAMALAALALLAFVPSLAAASDGSPVLSRIVKSGKLRVGMSADQPPFNMRSKSGEVIGMEADLAQLLAQAMGVEPQIVTKPFGELVGALQKGEVDVVMSGMTITPERNLKVAFVGPYFVSGKSILTKSTTLAAADEAGDLDASTVTLAALAGSTSQLFVEKLIPNAQLLAVENYEDGVAAVVNDKADALVAAYPTCVLETLRNADAGLVTLVAPLTIEPIGVALPAGDPLLVNLVQNYMNALEGTGVLELLRKRWFEDGAWLAQLP